MEIRIFRNFIEYLGKKIERKNDVMTMISSGILKKSIYVVEFSKQTSFQEATFFFFFLIGIHSMQG